MQPSKIDLSIIIPVFNELENVAPLHAEIHQALDPTTIDYEILFVDDGSKDGTSKVLRELQALDPKRTRV